MMKKAIATAVMLALTSQVAVAEASDPAIDTVQTLDNGLLSIMRASSAGVAGRSRMIAPVIDRAFDVPLMTRLAVGPSWNGLSDKDQAGLISAFRGLTIAEYAKNFDDYSGERFDVSPQVLTRGSDKLVRTTLVSPGSKGEPLAYRLRQSSGKWKIIDVYYRNSISQLATRRSDFARVLQKGGAPALISHLNQLASK
jgi:phospholipid transport system substrate-binding protein